MHLDIALTALQNGTKHIHCENGAGKASARKPSRLFEERTCGQLQNLLSQLSVRLCNWFKIMVGLFIFTNLILPGGVRLEVMPGNGSITSSPNRKQEQQIQFVPFVCLPSTAYKIQHFPGQERPGIRFATVKAFCQTSRKIHSRMWFSAKPDKIQLLPW